MSQRTVTASAATNENRPAGGRTASETAPRPFHVMGKPAGPMCNLRCEYCFYLDKEALYPSGQTLTMSEEVLTEYIRQYIACHPGPEVTFAWQGGEPTLLGVPYFRRIVELQQRFATGRTVWNSIQTNGTLLDDEWGAFLNENRFLVGISIDGPRELHDRHRVDRRQRPTFDRVMAAIELLERYSVEFNALTVVHRESSRQPREVYRFLKALGARHLQFIPLVERSNGVGLLSPPAGGRDESPAEVTPWSVRPGDWGDFLLCIFQDWVQRDVGSVFVQTFEVALGTWMGLGSRLCIFAETCGRALALEHNGDVYACDHYVYPEHKRGNLLEQRLEDMADSPEQRCFGDSKRDALPDCCTQCDVLFACHGECPRNRFVSTLDGQAGLNYLCEGYRRFFRAIDEPLKAMASLLRAGRPASDIMRPVASWAAPRQRGAIAKNSACPCGSGLKFKRCHGRGP